MGFQKGTGSCYQLDLLFLINQSGSRWVSDQNAAVLLSLGRDNLCQQKITKSWKKSLELTSDQTSVRSNWPLIRQVTDQNCLQSDRPELSDLWSDKFKAIIQTKVRSMSSSDHVIRAHRVRRKNYRANTIASNLVWGQINTGWYRKWYNFKHLNCFGIYSVSHVTMWEKSKCVWGS